MEFLRPWCKSVSLTCVHKGLHPPPWLGLAPRDFVSAPPSQVRWLVVTYSFQLGPLLDHSMFHTYTRDFY
jgi:hypothetical protein